MTEGLVGYWGFEEGSGTLAHDGSNYANDGVLTSGPSWTKGKVGGALSFDGSNDYVDAGNNDSLKNITTAVTVEAWAKRTAAAAWHSIVSKNTASDDRDSYRLMSDPSGIPSIDIFANTAVGTAMTQDVWYHLVGTWDKNDSGTIRFYQDGVLKNTGTYTGNLDATTVSLSIGRDNNGALFFPGLIDEVRIYNRALSNTEVRYHYNKGGPVAQWKFDEGEGRTAYDSTDNNNDGTLVLAGSATSSAWVAGKSGSALSFDGVNDYVNAGSGTSLDIANTITVSMWVKVNSVTSWSEFYCKGYTSLRMDASSNFQFNPKISGTERPLSSGEVFNLNQWYHVVGTFDGTARKIYVNGVLKNSNSDYSGTLQTGGNAYIGTQCDITNYFNGLIDDVRIYNYARTPEQIRTDYNAGLSTHFK